MDKELDLKYYALLEELLAVMTSPGKTEPEMMYKPLEGICKLFRLSKGVTRVFKSPAHEKAGQGESFVCYDNGVKGKEVYSKRIVTNTEAVAQCLVYMPEWETPLTEEERNRIDIIMNSVIMFVTRNRLEAINEKLMFFDENGYPNTRSFMRYITEQSEQKKLGGKCAIRFNLRHFSLINKEIGWRYGDIVIRKYFELLQETIGKTGIICRIGGDNFAIIAEKKLLEPILDILRGIPIVYDLNRTKRVMVSAYAGVFVIPEGFELERPTDDIMDRIATSLREAKTGDSIVFFGTEMLVDKDKKMRIQQNFPKAVEEREFKVFYQPKVDIQTGEIVGAEALCRWFHEGKLIPPVEFIPVLEQTTAICALDFYMLNEVCKDIRRWLDEGRKAVRVSVNFSRKHMMDIDLLQRIIGIIKANNIPPDYIEIELTETTSDVEFRDLKRVVSGLQQAGIYTSVDDFGMGYSSLNLIREIPWNVIKVDKSFLPVEGEDKGSNRSILFKYVVAMAREMGLVCIAEGVETKQQVEVLKENKCGYAQGFYFDKPLPIDEFEERLDTHRYDMDF